MYRKLYLPFVLVSIFGSECCLSSDAAGDMTSTQLNQLILERGRFPGDIAAEEIGISDVLSGNVLRSDSGDRLVICGVRPISNLIDSIRGTLEDGQFELIEEFESNVILAIKHRLDTFSGKVVFDAFCSSDEMKCGSMYLKFRSIPPSGSEPGMLIDESKAMMKNLAIWLLMDGMVLFDPSMEGNEEFGYYSLFENYARKNKRGVWYYLEADQETHKGSGFSY